jgi:osmotically-inducible protein OsmY
MGASAVPSAAQESSSSTPAPDNTANNKQHAMTADNQTNAVADRETARRIRKSVIADKSLSIYAHNVKIIVLNGAVTLKGPVHSENEKKRIGDLATEIVGSPDKVTNDISVKAGS